MPYDLLFGGGSYEHNQMKTGVSIAIDGADVSIPISVPMPLQQARLDTWFGAEKRPDSPETIRLIMKDGKVYKNTLN